MLCCFISHAVMSNLSITSDIPISPMCTNPFRLDKRRPSVQSQPDWWADYMAIGEARGLTHPTVVTASSDGTVKAWSPHSFSEPSVIGTHADYVRCLASRYVLSFLYTFHTLSILKS